ncbi:hypothetical protein ACIQ7Q_31585 [Streptomyces sp. NPDC096176]|uniref:hypothetical protein n=1 Tax=Streptomyces sp. NPDC096176 TaxID=3366079 RepID=UPI003811661E
MGIARILTAGALAAAALLAPAGAALADDASPSPSPSTTGSEAGPTEAGTTFRTATPIEQDQKATANASSGDYLYWVFPADAEQRPTVRARVTLPDAAERHGESTWRIDVYDGLRRRQACMYGMQARTAAKDATDVELSCVLRTVRSLAEQWADDPLPGSYYVRLTVTGLPEKDLGLPVSAEVEAVSRDAGGGYAVDGALAEPLVPGVSADGRRNEEEARLDWSSGRWSDRWAWTAAGGLLAALAGVAGHGLTRGSGRPSRVPPGA